MLLVILVLIAVQTIFSLWPVLIKILLDAGVSAGLLGLIRDIIASILLWMGVWMESGYPGAEKMLNSMKLLRVRIVTIDKFEKILFFILGVSSSVNSISYVLALHYVTPFNSALLHPTIPVFATVLGALFGVERLTPRKLLGACICIAGSLVVVASQSDMHFSLSLYGNCLLIIQSFAMASLLVSQKFVPPRYSTLKTTALYYTIGTVISTPVCLAIVTLSSGFTPIGVESALVIAFGAIFVVAFNYAALTWANKASSPAVPASSMMLQPPFTYIIGYLFGTRQHVSWWEMGGGAVIIAGLTLTTISISGSSGEDYSKTDLLSLQDDGYAEEEQMLISHGVDFQGNANRGNRSGYGFADNLREQLLLPPLTKRTPSASSSDKMSSPSSSSISSSRSSSPGAFADDFAKLDSRDKESKA